MKLVAATIALLLASTTTAPATPASLTARLNATHHRLRIEQSHPVGLSAPDDALTRVAVGAELAVAVPATLGEGHGPFLDVYHPGAPLTVTATGMTVDAPRGDEVAIRCNHAGTFELAVGVDGIADTIDVTCIAATRFEVTHDGGPAGPFLAGASTIGVEFAWYGTQDGRDVRLAGTFPVAVAPGETAIAPDSVGPTYGSYIALHRATAVAWRSDGMTATLPVDIVDAHGWRLDVAREPATTTRHGKPQTLALARAVDDHGRRIDGLTECTLTQDGKDARTSCVARLVEGEHACFAVLDQTACD